MFSDFSLHSTRAKFATTSDHPDVAASKYNIASLKESQGDLEGARRLFLECEQIYAKVLGADDEENRGDTRCCNARADCW